MPPRKGAGYSIPAAAEVIGCSYKTLLSATMRGEVQIIEFGGRRRVPVAEVARLKTAFQGVDDGVTTRKRPHTSDGLAVAIARIRALEHRVEALEDITHKGEAR